MGKKNSDWIRVLRDSDVYGTMMEVNLRPRLIGDALQGLHKVVALLTLPDGLYALPTTSNVDRPVPGTLLDRRIFGTAKDGFVLHTPIYVPWTDWQTGRYWLTLPHTVTDTLATAARPHFRNLGLV